LKSANIKAWAENAAVSAHNFNFWEWRIIMIKAITGSELRVALRERIELMKISEAKPDPGPHNSSERSSNLYELAFRRGTVRQISELIVLAEYGLSKPGKRANENDWTLYREACKEVVEEETRKLMRSYNRGSRKIPLGLKGKLNVTV
jgi:hypothetical protein